MIRPLVMDVDPPDQRQSQRDGEYQAEDSSESANHFAIAFHGARVEQPVYPVARSDAPTRTLHSTLCSEIAAGSPRATVSPAAGGRHE